MRLHSIAACVVAFTLLSACNLASQSRVESIQKLNEGIKQLQKNNTNGAEKAIQDAIKADPTYSVAHYNLAKLYRKDGKIADAIKAYGEAIRTLEAPNSAYQYELGLCYEALSEKPDESREAKITAKREAIRAFEAATQINPSDYKSFYHIGVLNEDLDDPEKADAAYRKSIDLNSGYSPAFVALGNMYIDYGHSNVALAVLETGTKVNAADAAMWNGMGRAMLNMNLAQKAVDAYSKAKAIDPDMPDVLFGLGMSYAELGDRPKATENLNMFLRKAGTTTPDHIKKSAEHTLGRLQDVI
jgi:tetratricopeptide (TPR) repeat protein